MLCLKETVSGVIQCRFNLSNYCSLKGFGLKRSKIQRFKNKFHSYYVFFKIPDCVLITLFGKELLSSGLISLTISLKLLFI